MQTAAESKREERKHHKLRNIRLSRCLLCGGEVEAPTHSQIDGPLGWKPWRAFAVFARASSVITVLLVGLLMFLVHNSGRLRPNVPAEKTININTPMPIWPESHYFKLMHTLTDINAPQKGILLFD